MNPVSEMALDGFSFLSVVVFLSEQLSVAIFHVSTIAEFILMIIVVVVFFVYVFRF